MENSNSILSIQKVSKKYADGLHALKEIDLEIREGEIFALLGPNGAGKTTLINSVCGIVTKTSGQILVGGYDNQDAFRETRSLIGLVPQELTTDAFETVWNTVTFSRGLFGKKKDPVFLEKILKQLSLWDKKDKNILTLSGGMKRRVMIAKALSHEPKVLFLDEPTAGVDVNLRRDMWRVVRELKESGVTIILTTHYIEEAEEMADRIGVINQGKIILVEEKNDLMKKLGRKELLIDLETPMEIIPPYLEKWDLTLQNDGNQLRYLYDSQKQNKGIAELLGELLKEKIAYRDIHTSQSSLEDIFVQLVEKA